MASSAWKEIERIVAAIFAGVRSWDTDHDVLVVTDHRPGFGDINAQAAEGREHFSPGVAGAALLALSRAGYVELASIEVKNLKAPSVAQLEAFLVKNRAKADRDGVRHSALVIKRKAGRGRPTPFLLVMEVEPPEVPA